ncbi:hypothetical protein [Weissella paramesenteroides]|uniref:hypothetical protein n=1 Tax=Weissella paramesenteroides TaxID=1249 RepID=UPI0010396759|nr:hypothetical protein [Weissella paramesenteroides]KAA8445976.1 hypothetical protein FKV72_04805 [Weissella paramesenteroides]KAA8453112.1 hypothetical protein FKV71_03400 [Weissella paramesenteroides]MBU7556120.1 hypothetical protein [Weissella paramesenteroides]MCT0486098.1 hypothetical protein [Weissella paramesenteroides]NEZ89629.1 hypothetical protein [Weissella paramesenteroides]
MIMKKDELTLNPEAFALAVLGGNLKEKNEENKTYIKRQLTLYLEALLVAQDFNGLEESQLEAVREAKKNQILEKLIERRYS